MDTRWTVWPAAIRPAKGLIVLLVATAAILAGPPASGQTPTPSAGTLAGSLADSLFEQVAAQAENMANAPFQTADVELTGALADIDYDAYRTIRFRKDQALWRDETPFSVELFHLGFLFRTQVQINLVDESGTHALPFDQTLFDYGQSGIGEALGSANSDAAAAIGYAGFKILYPLHRPDVRDEVAVFLGASYFRLLARNQVYGLSARGLALGTASPEGEEFPTFREFWLVKPAADSGTITVYALLDSPSLTGAYRFDIRPGAQTVVDTRLRLFARADEPLRPGLAPLTSMFLYGENRRPYHDDYRPEVHDSDGVLMHTARGEWLWRPVANPARLRVTTLLDDAAGGPAGFGLMQRDRDFANYLDSEAHYERRPSLWVEPVDGWGPGAVHVVEIPSPEEINDNIVAFWQPAAPLTRQAPLEVRYRQYALSTMPDGHGHMGHAVRTREGWASVPGSAVKPPRTVRRLVVDFTGGALDGLDPSQPVAADLQVTGALARVDHVAAVPGTDLWRVSFTITPDGGDAVDMRLFLSLNGQRLSETWTAVWSRHDLR